MCEKAIYKKVLHALMCMCSYLIGEFLFTNVECHCSHMIRPVKVSFLYLEFGAMLWPKIEGVSYEFKTIFFISFIKYNQFIDLAEHIQEASYQKCHYSDYQLFCIVSYYL